MYEYIYLHIDTHRYTHIYKEYIKFIYIKNIYKEDDSSFVNLLQPN